MRIRGLKAGYVNTAAQGHLAETNWYLSDGVFANEVTTAPINLQKPCAGSILHQSIGMQKKKPSKETYDFGTGVTWTE